VKKKKRYQGIGLEHRIMKLEGCCAAGRESGGLVRKELRLGLQERRKSIVYESRFVAHGFCLSYVSCWRHTDYPVL
jgi:hypothetical protein